MSDSDDGSSRAAAAPWTTRAASRISKDGAAAQPSDATANAAMPSE
jgi:hypothetical protein